MCAAALRPIPAFAQPEIDEARKNARLHIGGIYLTPTFQVKEFGLDTNVFNQSGEQTPDFVTTLSPGADVALPIAHRALLTSHVDADVVYFAHYATERSINPNISLRASGFFHRLTVFAEGGYLNSRQRLNQEIDARARRTDESVGAGLELRIVPKMSLTLAGHAGRTDYAEDQFFRDVNLRQSLAEDARSLTGSINYKATPLTTFALRGEVQQDRFLYSSVKSSDSYRVMPGVEFKPRALISGSAYVGFQQFKPLNASVPGFRGMTAAMSLRYALRSATAFSVTLDRGVQSSYEEINPYFVSTAVGVLVRRQLKGPFDATVGAQRYYYAYQRLLTSLPNLEAPRVDVTYTYSGDIGYRLGRKGRLGFGVSYWTRDSNRQSGVAYQRFRVGSNFSYGG